MDNSVLFTTNFPTIPLLRRGKVRDVYDLGEQLLIVTTDRISAFDVIMGDPIPGKGKLLTELSLHWFGKTSHIVENHIIASDVLSYPTECVPYSEILAGRSMMVKKAKPLPIECVVRGYLAGSGWKEYSTSGTVCGIKLPSGLQEGSQLPEPIFTPATKADEGHDENISYLEAVQLCGKETVDTVRRLSLKLYQFAAEYTKERGIVLADTKFEFGFDASGALILIDEALTPDSSRYWLASDYAPGKPQINFDKQVLRDYLETLDWNKQPPPPKLPSSVVDKIIEKYCLALKLIIE